MIRLKPFWRLQGQRYRFDRMCVWACWCYDYKSTNYHLPRQRRSKNVSRKIQFTNAVTTHGALRPPLAFCEGNFKAPTEGI